MGTNYKAFTGKALMVDLTTGAMTDYMITDEDRDKYLGNKGIAAKILYDCMEPGIDPLSPENHFVISTAALTGTGAPCSSRFNVSTKSPLTGIILASNCGGNFGIYLKRAGLDVLILKGRAAKPVYLEVKDQTVVIKDAGEFWGMDTDQTQKAMTKIYGKKCGQMAIGPAGENLVRFACILSGERALGRAGVGAVMGSKNVKALVALGDQKPEVAEPEKFKAAIKAWINYLKNHPVTGNTLPAYGTAGLLLKASTLNCLPTKNFKTGTFEFAAEISGEALAEKHLVKNDGCQSCPIRCGRVVEFEGENVKGPEYETVGMFGSNIGNKDLGKIVEWNVLMDRLGMDTITAGGVFAFTMEATENGLMKSDLKFGKIDNIPKYIEQIAYRRGLGNDMAEGVLRLAEKFGGFDYAMHAKGLEFAAYEPRGAVGQGLGYATANRGGCHLNSGYLVYFEALGPVNIHPYKPGGKAEYAIFQQNTFEAVSACGSCIFTTYAVIPPQANSLSPHGTFSRILSKVLLASAPLLGAMFKVPDNMLPINLPMIPHSKAIGLASGQKMDAGRFLGAGGRCYNLERMFNVREGMVIDALPKRSTEQEQIPGRPETKVPLGMMLPAYYKARGWDNRGVPTAKTLRFYGIDFALKDIPDSAQSKVEMYDRFLKRRMEYEKDQARMIAETVKTNQARYGKKGETKPAAKKATPKKATAKKAVAKKPAVKKTVKK